MILKQAFSWLYSYSNECSWTSSSPSVTLAICMQAIDGANEHYDQTLKTYRAFKYSSTQQSESSQAALNDLKLCEQYLAFLKCCEVLLQDLRPYSLYQLMMTIALDNPALHAKVGEIFAAWLMHEPKLATDYYETYYDKVAQKVKRDSPEAGMVLMLGEVLVQHDLKELRLALQYQDNPLAICKLLAPVSAIPTRYAAFIIWMLEQSASINQLLQSGILQQFLGYHFDTLHSDACEDSFNPVVLLYGLLQRFPCAVPMVDAAKQVSCDIRGHSAYNLLGQQQESLIVVNKMNEFPLLTRTEDNIKQVIHVFGQPGLVEVVRTLLHDTSHHRQDDSFHRCIIQLVRKTPSLITPGLIKQVAEERATELRRWASFIDDGLFQQWRDSNELAILFLIPHKPHWLQEVTVLMMQCFLELIQAANQPGTETENMSLFMCLYQIASLHQVEMMDSIYERMLDFTLRHRYLLEDGAVFRTLKNYRQVGQCVSRKADVLMSRLDEITSDCLHRPFSEAGFLRLHSDWTWLGAQMEILHSIHTVRVSFPKKEVDWVVYLFKQYSLTHEPDWQQLMDALQLNHNETPFLTNKNKQTLLSVLTSVDDESLRQMIMSKFEINVSFVRRQLLLNAIRAGNKGLIDWYLQRSPLDVDLFEQAVACKQWSILKNWMDTVVLPKLTEAQMDHLLIEATGSCDIKLIRLVIKRFNASFSESAIAQAVSVASQHDDDKALYYLYALKPTSRALQVGFAQAIHQEKSNALVFFIGMKKKKPHLAYEMERAFNIAVKKNDVAMVSHLTRSNNINGPSRKVIQAAMEKAMDRHQTEMVTLLKNVLHPSSQANDRVKNMRPNQSFCSTDSLSHLSLFSSPVEVGFSVEPCQSTASGGVFTTPLLPGAS